MFSLGSFLAGAVATVLAKVFARPLAVTTVSYGYTAVDSAKSAWQSAREEVNGIRADARAMYDVRSTRNTIAELRREIAQLRAELAVS
ncbi:MAG: hypothetical protein AB7O67_17890 [Vicinamibacterales bacterium]